MLEIQARLTNDPNDKEPLHKKQPTAVSSNEIWGRSDSNHPRFIARATRSLAPMNFWPELGCIPPSNDQVYTGEFRRTEVAFEPFPTATEYTIVGTTHQITTYLPSFGKKRRMRTNFLSLPKRLKRIFQRTE